MFRCLSVVYDEGLRSYKAIAFIKGSPRFLRSKSTSYLKSGAVLGSTVLNRQKTLRDYSKNLGEKLWIK
jgi:hypothetical protein